MAAGVCIVCVSLCVCVCECGMWHVEMGLCNHKARDAATSSKAAATTAAGSEPALTVIVCDFCTTLQQKTAKRETSCGVFSAPRLLSRQRRDRETDRQAEAGQAQAQAQAVGRQITRQCQAGRQAVGRQQSSQRINHNLRAVSGQRRQIQLRLRLQLRNRLQLKRRTKKVKK